MVVSQRHSGGLLLLLLLPAMLFAQEQAAPAPTHRTLLLHVDQQPGVGLSDSELFMVSRSLLTALQSSAQETLTFVESPELAAPAASVPAATADHLTNLAKSVGADAWVWVQLAAEPAALRLRVRSFDLFDRQMTLDLSVGRERSLSVLDLPYEKWKDIVPPVLDAYQNAAGAAVSRARQTAVVTIRALPGTRIGARGGPAVTVDQDGFAQLTLASPAEYSLRAVLGGYGTETETLFLTASRKIDFDQKPSPQWAVEASLKDLGYPGFDLTRFLSPNMAWLRLGITTYGVGLALVSQSSDQNGSSGTVFTSNPLTNVVFQGGIYLSPDDQLFRFYYGFGCFLRVLHAPGLPVRLEPISWGGFQVTVGTEIGRTPTGRFFFEYTPMFYSVSMPSLFQASLGTDNAPPGWIFVSGSAISLLSFRVGYRWML
jgi:hypothetical protein